MKFSIVYKEKVFIRELPPYSFVFLDATSGVLFAILVMKKVR